MLKSIFFRKLFKFARGELWTIVTEENVWYALAAERFLHFTDGFIRVHLFSFPAISQHRGSSNLSLEDMLVPFIGSTLSRRFFFSQMTQFLTVFSMSLGHHRYPGDHHGDDVIRPSLDSIV